MSATPSNILIFMTDQQLATTVLPDGTPRARTPVLDRFREEAVTFRRAYCPSPHCCPSRASFFTGLHPSQHGVWNNIDVANALSRGPRPGTPFWSVDLAAAGYQMRFSGKWHVSKFQSPTDLGWGEQAPRPINEIHPDLFAIQRQALDTSWEGVRKWQCNPPPQSRPEALIPRPGYPDYVHYGTRENPFKDATVVEQAIGSLQALGPDRPFCLYAGTLGPHDPYMPPQEFLDLYPEDALPELPATFYDPMIDKPGLYRRTRDIFAKLTDREHRQALRHYLAFCSYEDALFGRILQALEASGRADDTLVLYMSDHGDYAGDHGLWTKGLPAFLSAYHVPVIARMPRKMREGAGTMVDAPISLVDFAPTFREFAGLPEDERLAGQSLMPFLRGQTPESWRDTCYFQSNGNETYGIQRTVVTDDWMLVFNGFDYDELYHLRTDPGQMRNLADRPEHEAVKQELYRRLWAFAEAHDDTYNNGYIMTAMGAYGPGVRKAEPLDLG